MTDTGRVIQPLGWRTQRTIFGTPGPSEIVEELDQITTVDLAHVVMLVHQGLMAKDTGVGLLRTITRLRSERFRELYDLPAPRGLYLMYEDYLTRVLGAEVGGTLHTGRSRNDLKATTQAMRLRDWLLGFLDEAVRLEAVLLSRARVYRDVVMPVYTHFQAAMPITYGYYLAGVVIALGRDIDAAQHAADGLRQSPMGAGAIAGTDLPIDPALVARLLGFDEPPVHAIDAVASRDVLLRILGAASSGALTLSRLGMDLQLWSTAEFGFLVFPDRLVGGSSAMPQKRNAFLLEHVKAKAGIAAGAWTAATAAMKSTPFTNSIEVGTEAVSGALPGLDAAAEAILLCQVLVSGARPAPERMLQRAEEGFTTATSIANRLVLNGVPFRVAHHAVGAAVREAVARGTTRLPTVVSPEGAGQIAVEAMDTASTAAAHDRGGGPGAFNGAFAAAYQALLRHRQWCSDRRERLRQGRGELADAVGGLLAGHQDRRTEGKFR